MSEVNKNRYSLAGGNPEKLYLGCFEKMINTEAQNNELARIHWQCRRGMLELDLFLQSFMDKAYMQLTPKEKETFSLLLETPDQMLFDYFMGRVIPYDKDIADVVKQIRLATGPVT